MDTDYRALCAELLDALDGWHQAVFETGTGWVRPDETYLLDRARAALAEPVADGPAVPEGREPASVVSEPSDEELDAMERQCYLATEVCNDSGCEYVFEHRRYARAVLARWGHQPAPPAEVTPGPSIEAVGSLIAWLSEQACQAADAGQPTDAGMLTWAAQVIGERVDEAAPAPPAEGDVAELVAWLRGANWDSKRQTLATRAADLLEQFSSGWVVPTVEQFAPVPEEEPPHPAMPNLTYLEMLSVERQRLRALFTAEVERQRLRALLTAEVERQRLHALLPATALPLTTDADQPPA